jgi:hypothetical protein
MVEVIMSRKKADPFWTVRGVSGGEDVCLVIEAPSAVAAECSAAKRAIEVVFVNQSIPAEVTAAKLTGRLWRYTPEARLKCFGRAVGHAQAACLVLCGMATVLLDLHAHRIPLRLHW